MGGADQHRVRFSNQYHNWGRESLHPLRRGVWGVRAYTHADAKSGTDCNGNSRPDSYPHTHTSSSDGYANPVAYIYSYIHAESGTDCNGNPGPDSYSHHYASSPDGYAEFNASATYLHAYYSSDCYAKPNADDRSSSLARADC